MSEIWWPPSIGRSRADEGSLPAGPDLTGLAIPSKRSHAIAVREIRAFLRDLRLGPQAAERKEAPWILAPSAKPNPPTSRSSRT